jgi:hypothetical protein
LALWVGLWANAQAASGPPFQWFASTQPAALSATAERYCSTWEFFNNTGQDVNGLRVRLKGVKTVTSVYTGTLNPFATLDSTSGYSVTTDTYSLNFSGGTAFDSDQVLMGFCTDTPLLRLDQQSGAFVWTVNGTATTPAPLFTGLEWNWQSRSQLRLRIVNEQNVTMTLSAVNLLDAGSALTLEDLNGPVISTLPFVLELQPNPQALAPNSDNFFDVFFDTTVSPNYAPLLEPNHPYILEAVLTAEDDPGNAARLYAQGLSPLIPLYLPLVVR